MRSPSDEQVKRLFSQRYHHGEITLENTENKPSNTALRKFWTLIGIGSAAGLVAFVTHRYSIVLCPLYALTGVPCPTCGMTRSWLHILGNDIEGAFRMHPLFLGAILIPFGIFFYRKKDGSIRKWLRNVIAVAVVVLILVWIWKMIQFFPNQEPLVWNEAAPMRIAWKWFQGLSR